MLPKLNSAHGSETRNIINRTIEVLNRLGIDVQTLVANGQLTDEQYARLLRSIHDMAEKSEVRRSTALQPIDVDEMNTRTKQLFTGGAVAVVGENSVGRENIKVGAVSPAATTFFKRKNKNLFDGEFVRDLGYFLPHEDFDYEYGRIDESRSPHTRAAVVRIDEGETYTVTKFRGGDNFRIALINEFPTIDAAPIEVLETHLGERNSLKESYTFENTVNAKYLYLMTNSNSTIPAVVQVERGNESTDYEPHSYIPMHELDPKLLDSDLINAITPENTTFFNGFNGNNLFSGIYHSNYGFFNPQENTPYGHVQKTRSVNNRAAIVKIERGKTYTVTKYSGGDRFNILLLDERPNETNTDTPLGALYLYRGEKDSSQQVHTVDNEYGANYMFIQTNLNDPSYAELQVEEGTESTSYNSGAFIPKEYIDPSLTGGEQKDNKFNFTGDFQSLYEHQIIDDFIDGISNIQTSEVNALFMSLVDENADIGSSTLLGKDDTDKDVYMFESKPPRYNDAPYVGQTKPDHGEPMEIPKIVITGGIHGSEKGPPISIYYFLKTLWENPNEDATIDSLVQNVHFIFIPIVGPEGYDAATYSNGSQNLNRDFPPYGNINKKSTQYTKDILDANSNMDFFIDFHNMFGRDGMLGYVLTNDPFWKYAGTNIYKDIGMRWSKKNNSIPSDRNHKFAVATEANAGTIGRYAQDVIGTQAALLEVPRKNPFNLDESEYEEHIIRLGVDILYNAVYSAIRNKQ